MKLGILGAMHSEVEHLQSELISPKITMYAGLEVHEGLMGSMPVAVVRCGEGKVNAAMCAQALIARFGVTHVINTGVAGSLDASIDIGDLVVSTDLVHHDYDTTVRGFAPGEIPEVGTIAFEASVELRAVVHKAARRVNPDLTLHDGRIATGDQFIADDASKQHIVDTFGALCCEMEGAAIAQVCYLNKIPFVVVRAISDKADHSSIVDFDVFVIDAAHTCGRVVEELASLLS